jgi:peptidoglycan hydrolase-like protein with peptidoglycan-binding domain
VTARRPLALLALAVALAGIALTGCGGDDSQEGATTAVAAAPPTTEASVEQPPPPPPEPPPPPAIVVQLIDGQPILTGEKGDHVLKLQEALVALGYDVGKLDGQYGPSTRKAIIAFQKKFKLGADGIVGKKTVKRLNAELKKLAQS